mmetsp:Transcript_57100/g.102052  ORF Transcript_57100/g.102052 Transcript_57100/m.102052 type:complete len:81 (+) Transcript_57100:27-269(+)
MSDGGGALGRVHFSTVPTKHKTHPGSGPGCTPCVNKCLGFTDDLRANPAATPCTNPLERQSVPGLSQTHAYPPGRDMTDN